MTADAIEYIRNEYLTLDQLITKSRVSKERILAFIEARCLPRHSYEVTETTQVKSFFGDREVGRSSNRYYAPSHLEKLRGLEEAAASPWK